MEELKKAIDAFIAKRGLKICKLIQSGTSGFFSYSPAVYDKRTVYSWDVASDLGNQGFTLDDVNAGLMLLNAIMTYQISPKAGDTNPTSHE